MEDGLDYASLLFHPLGVRGDALVGIAGEVEAIKQGPDPLPCPGIWNVSQPGGVLELLPRRQFLDPAAEKQAELQERMGLDPADNEADDSTAEARLSDLQREQLKKFLRRERKDGINKG